MLTFEKNGRENTEKALEIAFCEAKKLSAPIVLASNTGSTAKAMRELMEKKGETVPVVVVTAVYGMKEPGKNLFPEELRAELKEAGFHFVTAAHALSGAERSFSKRFSGQGPIEIMAHTLRMFSQGIKVCVECSVMALDAGEINYGEPVVAVGGTAGGADSVAVLTPGYTHSVLDTKVHEILCKPWQG